MSARLPSAARSARISICRSAATTAIAAAAGAALLAAPCLAQTISISLSDNVVVLSASQRFGVIEMANLGADPVEFSVATDTENRGLLADGTAALRWAPARTVAPAHRSAPFRVSMRTTPVTPPGEYVFRATVASRVLRAEPQRAPPAGDDAPVNDGIGGVVPISPALPVTVYVRHLIDEPMIDVRGWEPAVAGEFLGHFMVNKRVVQRSFVGHVEVRDKASGKVLTAGRLHLRPDTNPAQVRVPRPKDEAGLSGAYCLKVWSRFPAEGNAAVDYCSA